MKSKRNKIVNISIIVFIVIVVLCTYLSKTVKNMLLPEVTVAYLKPGTIGDGFEGTGTIDYEDTHKIYSMPSWSVKEISVKLNQSVKKGDVLAKVDNDAINLKEREEKAVIMQLQDEIDTLKKASTPDQNKINEDQYKLDTENAKYKTIRKGLTDDGSILSDVDGKIVSINSKNSGESSLNGQDEGSSGASGDSDSLGSGDDLGQSSSALFEIVSNEPSLCVKWAVPYKDDDKFSVGTKVNVISGDDDKDSKASSVTGVVSKKIYNSGRDEYEIYADINDKSNLKKDDKVTITTQGSTKRYNNVIPKSCLYEENGIDYVYEFSAGGGTLGEESSVKKVQVQVVAFDSMNCSIKAESNSQLSGGIVTNTSKPISDNDEVKCTFTAASR
ncbi:biotin/lipoyl-binding protein [Clostridium neuense]|uniref:Biotin/lipoyl-binding protein n=1 Tax=Clostridium neuense TaxID=1728934 RepID=A0ABW8TKW7_9CLOT